jgi:NMD protein affecting ribosome stability and mRNA decay
MRRERGPYRYQRLQVLEGYGNDAYRPGRKPAGSIQCTRCGAVFYKGRWSWRAAPPGAKKQRCPACRRIDEKFPAGYVQICGGFFEARRDEVLARVRHCETQEKAEHPLERIIAVEKGAEGALVTTTSGHLARLLGHALKSAFGGRLSLTYNRQDNLARVRWQRAAA